MSLHYCHLFKARRCFRALFFLFFLLVPGNKITSLPFLCFHFKLIKVGWQNPNPHNASHLIANSGYQLFNWYVSGEVKSSSLILICMLFQVKAALDVVSERLSAFTDVGNSCSHAEHILKDLVNFEEKSCVRTALLHISSMTLCVCVCVGECHLVTENIIWPELKLTAGQN